MSRALQISGVGVKVLFTPAGDRFAQQIELGSSVMLEAVDERTGEAELAKADDGAVAQAAAESWPPSPPLQDVHLEERPDGRQLALMIGRAGLSHWSISCELHPTTGELLFDVACRIKEPASWLGSTYQLPPGVAYLGDASSGKLLWNDKLLCRIATEADCEVAWNQAVQELVFRPRITAESPSGSGDSSFPRTIRWRYKLLVEARG